MAIRSFGAKWQADAGIVRGKRLMRVFNRQDDAKAWLRKQDSIKQNDRIGAFELSAPQARLAEQAFERITEAGLSNTSLLDFVDQGIRLVNRGSNLPLDQAIRKFLQHLRDSNKRETYIKKIADVLNRFEREYSATPIKSVTADQITAWLQSYGMSPQSWLNRRRELSVFFNWCVTQDLLVLNPAVKVSRPKVDRQAVPILSIKQATDALRNCADSDRAMLAIGLFAGLRPSEVMRLKWSEINFKRGYIDAKQTKTRDRRIVTMSENLKKWLKPIAKEGDAPISAVHERRWRDRILKAANFPEGAVWPQDILRHSFASYHLARHQDAGKTAFELGHKGNVQILYRHYREVVSPAEAEEYWSIRPG
jgi:integrase